MAYEIYKKKLTKDEYFSNWNDADSEALNELLKNQIYSKYLVKCIVFQRDNFKCQNAGCKFPKSPLTMHHVKWKKNGGEDKERNCVTLCETCHSGFHKGKRDIIFDASSTVPNHMKGHVFKLIAAEDTINWKELKKEMRKFRKNMKYQHGIKLSYADLAFLMKWLEHISKIND